MPIEPIKPIKLIKLIKTGFRKKINKLDGAMRKSVDKSLLADVKMGTKMPVRWNLNPVLHAIEEAIEDGLRAAAN